MARGRSTSSSPIPSRRANRGHELTTSVQLDQVETYRIVRFIENAGSEEIAKGLTEAEAKIYCQDPETSSSTASVETLARVGETLRWYDGFDPDDQNGTEGKETVFFSSGDEYRWGRSRTINIVDRKTGQEYDVISLGYDSDQAPTYSDFASAVADREAMVAEQPSYRAQLLSDSAA